MYKNEQIIKQRSKENSPNYRLKLPQLIKSPQTKKTSIQAPSHRSKNQSPYSQQKQTNKGRSISNMVSNNSLEVSTHMSTQERIRTNNFCKKSVLQLESLLEKYQMNYGVDQQYKYLDQLEKQSSILVHNYLLIHQQMIQQRNKNRNRIM